MGFAGLVGFEPDDLFGHKPGDLELVRDDPRAGPQPLQLRNQPLVLDREQDAAFGLYATNDINIDEEFQAQGVNLVAGNNVTIGEELELLEATIEAGNNIHIGEELSAKSTTPSFSHSSGQEIKVSSKLVQ